MGIGFTLNNGIIIGIEAIQQDEESPLSWEIMIALTVFNIHIVGIK